MRIKSLLVTLALFVCFDVAGAQPKTANAGVGRDMTVAGVKMLPNDRINPIFRATVQATEEAIINAMIAAETMTGVDGNTVYAIPHDRLKEVMKKYNRLK